MDHRRPADDDAAIHRQSPQAPDDFRIAAIQRQFPQAPDDLRTNTDHRQFPQAPDDLRAGTNRRHSPQAPDDLWNAANQRQFPQAPDDLLPDTNRRHSPQAPDDLWNAGNQRSSREPEAEAIGMTPEQLEAAARISEVRAETIQQVASELTGRRVSLPLEASFQWIRRRRRPMGATRTGA